MLLFMIVVSISSIFYIPQYSAIVIVYDSCVYLVFSTFRSLLPMLLFMIVVSISSIFYIPEFAANVIVYNSCVYI